MNQVLNYFYGGEISTYPTLIAGLLIVTICNWLVWGIILIIDPQKVYFWIGIATNFVFSLPYMAKWAKFRQPEVSHL